jgi:peptide/nickel transport system substrate-binding protein
MRKSLFTITSIIVVFSMALAGCAQATQAPVAAPTAQVVQQTVVNTVVVAGTPQTVVVTATPAPVQPATFKSKDPTTMVYYTFGEPETLDPALDYETSGGDIIANTYNTLIFYNREKPSEFVPMVATEVPSAANGGISADGMTYTFKIRQGIKFHNGDDLTPSSVAYTFQRGILSGGTASPQWLLVEPIMGSTSNNDITDQLDPDGSLGLVDSRDEVAKVDAAKLKATCELVQSKIKADDAAGTVTFTLAQAWGPFLATLANGWGAIQDPKWVAENGGWDGSCDTWQKFYAPSSEEQNKTKIGIGENGSGPYMLDHWTPKQEIVLKANPNYWQTEPLWEGGPSGAPKLQTVIYKSVDEFSTRFAAFQAGDADFVTVGSQADWPQMDTLVGETCDVSGKCEPTSTPDKPARSWTKLPQITRTDVLFNENVSVEGGNNFVGSGKLDGNGIPPNFFSDIHIRKAFNYCFDWDTYIADVLQGEGTQATTMFMPGQPGYDESAPHYTFDLKKCEDEFKASTLKSADGKSVWDTGFRLTVGYNTGNTARQTIAQILQANLSQVNPNFVLEVTGLPWPAYLQAQRAKKLTVYVLGWLEDIHDPHNWAFTYAAPGGAWASRQGIDKETITKLYDFVNKGVHESDPAKRAEIYKQFNQVYYDNALAILLANPAGRHYEQRWVKGYYYNPIYSGFYWYSMSKE